jgi:putative transcriptional regulator
MISFELLRGLLSEKGITTYYLRNKCGIYNLDSKTIRRLMEDESVSTNTIDSLCNILDCNTIDIMTFKPDKENEHND